MTGRLESPEHPPLPAGNLTRDQILQHCLAHPAQVPEYWQIMHSLAKEGLVVFDTRGCFV